MSQIPATDGINELLRNSLPGYITLAILLPLIPVPTLDRWQTLIAALFALGGPILGLFLSNLYLIIFREVAWSSGRLQRCLGLEHVTTLKNDFKGRPTDEIRAIWDYVFFTVGGPVMDRIIFLNSRAHSWGTTALGLLLGGGLWVAFDGCAGTSLVSCSVPSIPIILSALLIIGLPYPRAMRQGANLETVFLRLNMAQVKKVATDVRAP